MGRERFRTWRRAGKEFQTVQALWFSARCTTTRLENFMGGFLAGGKASFQVPGFEFSLLGGSAS
jgi:hypothetical protein